MKLYNSPEARYFDSNLSTFHPSVYLTFYFLCYLGICQLALYVRYILISLLESTL